MQVHNVKQNHKSRTRPRVGRGGKRGTYSGKGSKGQKAHGGRKMSMEKKARILRIPKMRGAGNKNIKKDVVSITLLTLDKKFINNSIIDFNALKKANIIPKGKNDFKIIGNLENFNKKFTLKNCKISAGCKALIEKAGGKIENTIVEPIKK